MAETIESFVAKLQAQGVEAGEQAASELVEKARAQAEQIIADAKKQADQITTQAQKQADELKQRNQTELSLATRDAVLRLQEALNRGLTQIIRQGVEEKVSDSGFLSELLHDLVMKYAQADTENATMTIRVNPEMRDKLLDWAMGEMTKKAGKRGLGLDLKGTLRQAGFEYTADDATVEVTADSIVETLSAMVSPQLREMLRAAMQDEASPKDSE